jgi:hypothetical protein
LLHLEDDTMTARSKLSVVALASVLVACLTGAGGADGGAPAALSAPQAGTLEDDRLHGAFWRPARSAATRPTLRLERAAWTPPESTPLRPRPDTLASLRAIVRLAASD